MEKMVCLESTPTDWSQGLPLLTGRRATVRELRADDAPTLLAMLNTQDVARYISPPPNTLAGFERFIARAHQERLGGRYLCFAVVPEGLDVAVGIIQVRQLGPSYHTAEWGFAIGAEYWGSGVFIDAARHVMDFAFVTLGVHRLEARSAVANGRGNGALRKLGATCEGLLRGSFLKNGEYLDQTLWSILDVDWLSTRWQKSRAVDMN